MSKRNKKTQRRAPVITTALARRYEVYGVDTFEMGGSPDEEPRYHVAWFDDDAAAIEDARGRRAGS